MVKTLTMEKIIEITNELKPNDKDDFKNIKQIMEAMDEDLCRLLFDIEFSNILTSPWKIEAQTESGTHLAHYIQNIVISDMVSILFRIWDNSNDVNSLYLASTILNKNRILKEFIINCYPCEGITPAQAKQIIEQVPHAHKHKLLQHIKAYRTERIGHNLQNKSVQTELFVGDMLKLGSIMIYADLTLKYASNFSNIVLGKIINYSKFPAKSNYEMALEELKNLLSSKGFLSNAGIRLKPLEYIDDGGLAKQILQDLKIDKDLFL